MYTSHLSTAAISLLQGLFFNPAGTELNFLSVKISLFLSIDVGAKFVTKPNFLLSLFTVYDLTSVQSAPTVALFHVRLLIKVAILLVGEWHLSYA